MIYGKNFIFHGYQNVGYQNVGYQKSPLFFWLPKCRLPKFPFSGYQNVGYQNVGDQNVGTKM